MEANGSRMMQERYAMECLRNRWRRIFPLNFSRSIWCLIGARIVYCNYSPLYMMLINLLLLYFAQERKVKV